MNAEAEPVRLVARVSGQVQGVGFRWWAQREAGSLGLVGSAANLEDGGVEIVAEGERRACAALLDAVRRSDAPGRVRAVDERWSAATGGFDGFETV